MGKLGRFAAVVLTAATGLGTLISQADVAGAEPAGDEAAFVAKLNEFRAARGLRILAVRSDLGGVARNWARQMQSRNTLAHNSDLPAQAPSDWDRLGENVGVGNNVQQLHDAFVASAIHVRQMVDERFDAVGVGVVPAGNGELFVTVNFMTTRGAPAPTPAAPPAAAPAATPPPAAAAQPASPAPTAEASPTRACRKTRKGRVCTTRRAAPRRAAVRRARTARR